MIDYNAYRRKIASLVDAENREEKAAAAMAQLSMEILQQFIRLTNGFSLMEAPALIAALDRCKSILLDTVNEDRMDIQKTADEVNQLVQVAFVCVKERRDSDAE